MEVRLLGRVGFSVVANDAEMVPVRSARAQLVLAALALSDGPVSTDVLADVAWAGSPPTHWRAALRNVVAELRSSLGRVAGGTDEIIRNERGGYRLDLPPGAEVDVRAVSDLAVQAEEQLASNRYEQAVASALGAMDRPGELLGDTDADWLVPHRTTLQAARQRALLAGGEASLAIGDPRVAVQFAERAVEASPLDERAHRVLIAAHDAAGARGLALAAYQRCRAVLAEELGIGPADETVAVYIAALGSDPAERSGLPTTETSFVGRREQLVALGAMVRSRRFVTLVGAAGIGKTRLAVEAARELRAVVAGGVSFVALESADDSLAPGLVAAALGAQARPDEGPHEALIRTLAAAGPVIAVLDGCDRARGTVADLATSIVQACPEAMVLVTARQRLGIVDETVVALDPLSSSEAVELLVSRAEGTELQPDADAARIAPLHDLCERVGRLPLAIELVARQLTTGGVGDTIDELDGSDVGDGPLAAALSAAVGALDADEIVAFARLGVLGGPAELSIVRDVVAGDGAIAPTRVARLLGALAERGVLWADRSGPRWRYSQHEAVRVRARALLTPTEEVVANGRLAKALHALLPADPQAAPDVERTRPLLPLVRAYLTAAIEGRALPGEALRLAFWLHRFWAAYDLHEGRVWLARLLDVVPNDTAHRSTALLALGYVCYASGDATAAEGALEEAALLLQREDDPLESRAYLWLGLLAEGRDPSRCTWAYEQALAVASRHHDHAIAERAGCALGTRLFESGDHASGLTIWRSAVERARADGDDDRTAVMLAEYTWNLVVADQGELADEALAELHTRIGNHPRIAAITMHHAVARHALAHRDTALAATSLTRALATMDEIGATRDRARLLCTRARIELADGEVQRAVRTCDDARSLTADSGELWLEAEVLDTTALILATAAPERVSELLGVADAIRARIDCARYPIDVDEVELARRVVAASDG